MTTSFGNDGPLKAGAITPLDVSTVVFVLAGSSTDLTIAGAAQGTGAVGSVTIGGTNQATMTVALAIGSSAGDGGNNYKIGDTVSVESTGGANFTGSITFVVTAAMLAQPTNTDEVISIPVDNIVGVEIPANSASALTFNTVSRNADLATWTFTIELDADAGSDAIVAVSEAIRKAKQAENSQPTVEWPNGVECYSLVFAG